MVAPRQRAAVGYEKKAGGRLGRPPWRSCRLIAGTFCSLFSFGHLLGHFGFDGVEVEAGAALHGRVIEEGLDFLAHHLLDEDEAPELVFEPVEVLLASFL